MKLLFLFSFLKDHHFNIGLNTAFEKHILEYKKYGYAEKTKQYDRDETNREILALANEFCPDVVFLQYIDAGDIYLETIKELSKKSTVVIWSGDMYQPTLMPWVFDYAPYVVSCFSNMDYINELRQKGFKAEFLNHYHEAGYFKIPNTEKTNDIVFIGSHFTRYPLSQHRYDLVKFLHDTYQDRFKLFGDNWPPEFNSRFVSREESNTVYNQSKIAVNASNLSSPLYTSDRLFHCMSSGTFTISEYIVGFEKLFTPGKEIIFYTTFEELKQNIDYYLTHDEEREKIAQSGKIKCMEEFGDKALVSKIETIYNTQKQTTI